MASKKPTLAINTEVDEINLEPEQEQDDSVVFVDADDLDDSLGVVEIDDGELPTKAEALETINAVDPLAEDVSAPVMIGGTAAVSSIADRIVDVDEGVEHLTWLVYGRNGSGKTTFLGSGGEGTLIAAVEDGTLTLRKQQQTMPTKAKKVRIKTWEDFEALYWLLRQGKVVPEGIEIMLGGKPYVVKNFAIDTITKLQNVCMRSVVLGERVNDASKDIINPTMRDWGHMSQKVQYWLSAVKDLPVQKIWACQERTNSDELDVQDFMGYPDLSKSLRNFVCGEADIIGRMYIKQLDGNKIQYRMLVGGNETYVTKDRTNMLGYALANPKVDKLYELIFKEGE